MFNDYLFYAIVYTIILELWVEYEICLHIQFNYIPVHSYAKKLSLDTIKLLNYLIWTRKIDHMNFWKIKYYVYVFLREKKIPLQLPNNVILHHYYCLLSKSIIGIHFCIFLLQNQVNYPSTCLGHFFFVFTCSILKNTRFKNQAFHIFLIFLDFLKRNVYSRVAKLSSCKFNLDSNIMQRLTWAKSRITIE